MGHRQRFVFHIGCLLAALTVTVAAVASRQALRDNAWIGILRFGSPAWRVQAATELGKGDARRSTPSLVRALGQDADQRVREAAADALGVLGPAVGDEAIAALVESYMLVSILDILCNPETTGPGRALLRIGKTALPYVQRAMGDGTRPESLTLSLLESRIQAPELAK